MSEQQVQLDALSADEKRELVARLLREKSKKAQSYPLSFSQQRLWYLYQLEPESTAYNLPAAFKLEGKLDVTAIEKSFSDLIKRHESLRTTFDVEDGEPVQQIAPAEPFRIVVDGLEEVSLQKREQEIRRRLRAFAREPFNLSEGPLLRAKLLRLAPEEHVLLFNIHHIISDGWSNAVLIRELAVLYENHSSGKNTPLPELPLQYVDFANWQREWLQGDELQEQLRYWSEHLQQVANLQLPTDRTRPAVQTYKGNRESFRIAPELTSQLKALCRKEGITPFILLLTAFKVLLYRYSGQSDIAVGSPIANRTREELEGLIGFFANTLVFRSQVDGEQRFRDLLMQVKETAMAAYAHQDVPFEKIVEALKPERDLSRSPLFQVMFILQNTPSTAAGQNDGLRVEPLDIHHGSSMFDLTLSLKEQGDQIDGNLEYNTDLFDAATIQRLCRHYQHLLSAIAANPEAEVIELPLLSDDERKEILQTWNATAADYPGDQCYHQLFEAQVRQTPDAVAVIAGKTKLSYAELDRKANQLANYLRAHGAGPEKLIGVFLARTADMVIALLGIMKAGAAYVPLDPAFPKDRLEYMAGDAQLSHLLTQDALRDLIATEAQTICLDSDWPAIASHSTSPPEARVSARNLAYVIYTSGSTGRPKGVQIEHQALVNFLYSMKEQPGITPNDVLVSVTTLSFDIAALEIYLPLMVGAKLVLASRENAGDGNALQQLLIASEATIMQATPATWRMLIDSGWDGHDQLKMLCGGEALPVELANLLLERGDALWNLYGPTETTIWSTVNHIEAVHGAISIGKPIANTQIYILDSRLQPVPVGVPGDLYIGGDGLSRGYLNRPGLTAEKFIASPFAAQPGERLYSTGDIARYRRGGLIEFLGRSDHQVKVRGFRIELGEIETAISHHPAVDKVVVVAREDVAGDKRLVAYSIMNSGAQVSAGEFKEFLRNKLPEYMIPSFFVTLDAFPLTPNNKIDRRALPKPDLQTRGADEEFIAPRSEMEIYIAGLWQEALGVENISVFDNFFDLGGHSLLSMQVIAKIEKEKDVRLNPRDFIFQTLEQIAATCEKKAQAPEAKSSRRMNRISTLIASIKGKVIQS